MDIIRAITGQTIRFGLTMNTGASILFLLFVSFLTMAQKGKPEELHFNRLFVKDGLPEGSVQALVQDKQGYLWIATQQGVVRFDGYKPKVYTFGIEDPYQRDILIIYLDREGRLWAGGRNGGLYCYDRANDSFILYKSKPSESDSSSRLIYNIHDDQAGNLWLLYWNILKRKTNLERFDLSTKKFIKYDKEEKGPHSINVTYFSGFSEDKNGIIWVGTNNGIHQYNKRMDHFEPYLAFEDSAKQNTFYFAPGASPSDTLWMAVQKSIPPFERQGLWRYDTKTNNTAIFRHIATDSSSIASDILTSGCRDSFGRVWASTDKGLSLFMPSKNNFTNYDLNDHIKGNPTAIRGIQVDKNNNFWLTTDQGLVLFNTQNEAYTHYPAREKDPYGLASNDIHDLFIDRSGTLWLGAGQIGLQWINKQRSRFIQYKDNPGQSHHFPGGVVNAFAESKDGSLWLASSTGMYHWNPVLDSFTLIKFSKGQTKDFNVSSLIVDKDGRVWCGVRGNPGLRCYIPQTGQTRYYGHIQNDPTSLMNNDVVALLEDHLGTIWVGTWGGGLCRFNDKSQNFSRFSYIENTQFITPDNGALDDDLVQCIYEDKNGTIWVGTNKGGLNRFNRQTGKFSSYNNQLPGFQCVTSIHMDSGNRLWVGTYLGGVFSLDPITGLAKKYGEKDGLLYDGAGGIVEDTNENLWLASPRGISIFNPNTKLVRNYTTANYLPSENFFRAFKTKSGKFLFSANDGIFITLEPDDFMPDPHPPLMNIESVNYVTTDAGKTIDSTLFIYGKDSLAFRHNENRLSFHYAGLYYQNPQLIQYAYKLDGYDNQWIPAGPQRSVTYTNLSPGYYTFHVKAANSDGVWNEQGSSFSFTILPPRWQTWWAYILYVLMLILAVWTLAAYRSVNLRRANLALEEKVAFRTIQLNQSIETLKATQSQLIHSEKMASLGKLTAGIAHEIQNPLNFVNNFAEINNELLKELGERITHDSPVNGERKINYDAGVITTLKKNSEKINHHGKRADAIVKSMLQHSRGAESTNKKEATDINVLAAEYFRLAYQGFKVKDSSFNARMESDFDSTIGIIHVIPQEIGRVLLNLFNNAFYAVHEKSSGQLRKEDADSPWPKPMASDETSGFIAIPVDKPEDKNSFSKAAEDKFSKASELRNYEPTVSLSTKNRGNIIEIRVKDNGPGIPKQILDKIFLPFFTTKPTGHGTGLGLSLAYDIIKAHGGEIKVITTVIEGSLAKSGSSDVALAKSGSSNVAMAQSGSSNVALAQSGLSDVALAQSETEFIIQLPVV